MNNDIRDYMEDYARRKGRLIASQIDWEVYSAMEKHYPITRRILFWLKWKWLAKITRFIIESRQNPASMKTEYRVLLYGKQIGKFAIDDYYKI